MYCRFVDISGIVDHHCLSFLFIYCMVKRQHTTPPSTQINHSCVCWYCNAPLYTNQPFLCVLVLQRPLHTNQPFLCVLVLQRPPLHKSTILVCVGITTPPSTQINHSCVCWYYNAPLYTNQPFLCVLVLQRPPLHKSTILVCVGITTPPLHKSTLLLCVGITTPPSTQINHSCVLVLQRPLYTN